MAVTKFLGTHRLGLRFGSKEVKSLKQHLTYLRPTSQVLFLRKSHGSRLNVFAPVNDLSALSKTGPGDRLRIPGKLNDLAIAGGQILGDEYSEHVVKVRHALWSLS
jgi:hypothetical protein